MPCTWLAVSEAMCAMTSLATLTEPSGRSGIALDTLHVRPTPGIDSDDIALIDKKRHVEGEPGLHGRRLATTGRRIALEAGRGFRDLEVDGGGQLDPQWAALVHQHGDRGVFLEVLQGVAQLVVAKGELIVALQVHEKVAVTVAVKVLHGHLLDPSAGKPVFVPELLVDDRPAADVPQLGAEKRVAAGILALLELEHDPEFPLPLDCHAVAKVAGVDHARPILPLRAPDLRDSPVRPAGVGPRSGQRWRCAAAA